MAREVDELCGFHIDDLLDFSNEDIFSSSTATTDTDFYHPPPASTTTSYSFSTTTATSSFPNDICLPNEDIAQLEWLSNFVADDDNSLSNFQYATNLTTRTTTTTTTTATNIVPGKARSKRSKASTSHHHSWNTSLQSIVPTTTNKFDNPLPIIIKNPEKETYYPASSSFITGRRCTHCASEKTPQWRTGPMGPKTLCNACGVRYKSGRLVPEYRPAASPTFVLTQHSNSHRKVLELRRQKEGMVMEDNNNNSHEFYHHRHNNNFKVC